MSDPEINEAICRELAALENFPLEELLKAISPRVQDDNTTCFTVDDAENCANKWDFLSMLYAKNSSVAIEILNGVRSAKADLGQVAVGIENGLFNVCASTDSNRVNANVTKLRCQLAQQLDGYFERWKLTQRQELFHLKVKQRNAVFYETAFPPAQHQLPAVTELRLINAPAQPQKMLQRSNYQTAIADAILQACAANKNSPNKPSYITISGESGSGKATQLTQAFFLDTSLRQSLQNDNRVGCVHWLDQDRLTAQTLKRYLEQSIDETSRVILVVDNADEAKFGAMLNALNTALNRIAVVVCLNQASSTSSKVQLRPLTKQECRSFFVQVNNLGAVTDDDLDILCRRSYDSPLIAAMLAALMRGTTKLSASCRHLDGKIAQPPVSLRDANLQMAFVKDQVIKYCARMRLGKNHDKLRNACVQLFQFMQRNFRRPVNNDELAKLWDCNGSEARQITEMLMDRGLLKPIIPCTTFTGQNVNFTDTDRWLYSVHKRLIEPVLSSLEEQTNDDKSVVSSRSASNSLGVQVFEARGGNELHKCLYSRDALREMPKVVGKFDRAWLQFKLGEYDDNGDTPLHVIARFSDWHNAVLVAKQKVDFSVLNKEGDSPLHTLCKLNISALNADRIMEAKMQLSSDPKQKAIFGALANMQSKDSGVFPNRVLKRLHVPQHEAAMAIWFTALTIIQTKARLSELNAERRTPLYYALATDKLELAMLLASHLQGQSLAENLNNDFPDTISGRIAKLHPDCWEPNANGNTLFHAIVACRCLGTMLLLLHEGGFQFYLNLQNKNGDTALHAAAAAGQRGFGFDEYQDAINDRNVVLVTRSYSGFYDTLVENGADQDVENARGQLPRDILAIRGADSSERPSERDDDEANIEDPFPYNGVTISSEYGRADMLAQQFCIFVKQKFRDESDKAQMFCDRVRNLFRAAGEEQVHGDHGCSELLLEAVQQRSLCQPVYYLIARLAKYHNDFSEIIMPQEKPSVRRELISDLLLEHLKDSRSSVQDMRLLARVYQNLFSSESVWRKELFRVNEQRNTPLQVLAAIHDMLRDYKKLSDDPLCDKLSIVVRNYAVVAVQEHLALDDETLRHMVDICLIFLASDLYTYRDKDVPLRAIYCLGTLAYSAPMRESFLELIRSADNQAKLSLGYERYESHDRILQLYNKLMPLLAME